MAFTWPHAIRYCSLGNHTHRGVRASNKVVARTCAARAYLTMLTYVRCGGGLYGAGELCPMLAHIRGCACELLPVTGDAST